MIQPFLIGIALLASFFGLLKTPTPIWDTLSLQFGATNFPSSLDTLTNPAGTDSVATVSHSGQHSNANDAIEAIEAKVGTGASTPVNNTILAGTGAGTSAYVTYATTTNLQSTNIVATGSSTLQNFTFVNATGTSATTTNSFSTNASSTNLFSTSFRGGGLANCSGSSFLQWTTGTFGCGSQTGISIFSTTTTANMATTTIRASELPTSDNLVIKLMAPDIVGGETATTTAEIWMAFNYAEDTVKSNYGYRVISNATAQGEVNINYVRISRAPGVGNINSQRFAEINVTNPTGVPKTGTFDSMPFATGTAAINMGGSWDTMAGRFVWATTTKATNIVFWTSVGGVGGALFATGTQIIITGF